MSIEIIRGAIGSGKTSYIFESVKKKISESRRKQFIIVPEQFSYETERTAVKYFGGTGLNGVEVITPSRLVSRFLDMRRKNRLTPSGKMMIIYSAVDSLPEESLFFGCKDKPGFLKSVADIISEFVEYMITPDILRAKSAETENRLLAEKLSAVAELLEKYLQFVSGKFVDSEEDLLALSEYAEESGEFSECDFWFDEFSVFLPQHYRLMKSLAKKGSNLHVSVCIDSGDRELYEINRIILNRLTRLGEEPGCEILHYSTDDVCRTVKSRELLFLLNNIDRVNAPGFSPYENPTDDLSIFVCKDLYNEVMHCALTIRRLVMEENFRYRDISVVCGNISAYSHIVEAVFSDLGLPYFSDTRLSAAAHPISTLIISAFEIISDNWSYPSVFRFLRTGFFFTKDENGDVTELSPEGIDLLENYVLKYGIRGKSMWLEDEKWQSAQKGFFDSVLSSPDAFTPDELSKINALRLTLTKPYLNFYSAMSGKRTVCERAAAFFSFLEDIHLYDGLNIKCDEYELSGLRNEAEQLRQVWNIILETLDQCVTVLGDKKCSLKFFCGLLSSGLSAFEISIIPSGVDRISVTGVEHSRQHSAKIMFILGAVSGAIPKETISSGIFSDSDRSLLRESFSKDGLEIAAESEIRNETDRFNFFSTLFGVSEKIFISYPAADSEGAIQSPAAIISDFFKVFPALSHGDDLVDTDVDCLIYSPRTAYRHMLCTRGKNGLSAAIYDWYEKNQPEKLDVISKAASYKKSDARICQENAKKLYSVGSGYSVSRLNEYGSCPFRYFVKYGLRVKEQEIRKIEKFDLGSIMHMALEMYCRRVDSGAETFDELRKNWLKLSKEKSDEIADEIMNELEEKILSGTLRDENKLRYIIMRMRKTVKHSIEAVRKSFVFGEYAAICYEQKFRVDVKWHDRSVPVDGVIDRVDLAETPAEKLAELRVADYKTGKKEFSIVSICNRQDLQLVMYAIAAAEMYRCGEIKYAKSDFTPQLRAVLYNRMRDDPTEAATAGEAIRLQTLSSRPDGLIVLDETPGGELDIGAALRMDSTLAPSSESENFRIKLKSGGDIAAGSQVTSTGAFQLLSDYVKKSVIEADGEIFDGIIKIHPACGKDTFACDWCTFSEVCLYNKKFDSTRTLVNDEKEAWEIIKKEASQNE